MSDMQLQESFDLDLDESSELQFKVQVEGGDVAPARVRLVCEAGDMAYMFNGHAADEAGVVEFTVPALKGRLKEGMYQSRVEVLIGDRYFAPVQFGINFKQAVKVTAEAVMKPKPKATQIKVSAEPVRLVEAPKPQPVEPPKPRPVKLDEVPKPKPQAPKPVTRVEKPAPVTPKSRETTREGRPRTPGIQQMTLRERIEQEERAESREAKTERQSLHEVEERELRSIIRRMLGTNKRR